MSAGAVIAAVFIGWVVAVFAIAWVYYKYFEGDNK